MPSQRATTLYSESADPDPASDTREWAVLSAALDGQVARPR